MGVGEDRKRKGESVNLDLGQYAEVDMDKVEDDLRRGKTMGISS